MLLTLLSRGLHPLTRTNPCGITLRLSHSTTAMSLKRKDPPATSASDPKKPKKNADLTSFFGPPRTTLAAGGQTESLTSGPASEPPAAKFDKEKWVAGLSSEQRQLLKLEVDTLDPSWLAVLKDEVVTPGFLELKRFLKNELDSKAKIYPPMEDVYSW
jgi:uracil-DNA glycosylase